MKIRPTAFIKIYKFIVVERRDIIYETVYISIRDYGSSAVSVSAYYGMRK